MRYHFLFWALTFSLSSYALDPRYKGKVSVKPSNCTIASNGPKDLNNHFQIPELVKKKLTAEGFKFAAHTDGHTDQRGDVFIECSPILPASFGLDPAFPTGSCSAEASATKGSAQMHLKENARSMKDLIQVAKRNCLLSKQTLGMGQKGNVPNGQCALTTTAFTSIDPDILVHFAEQGFIIAPGTGGPSIPPSRILSIGSDERGNIIVREGTKNQDKAIFTFPMKAYHYGHMSAQKKIEFAAAFRSFYLMKNLSCKGGSDSPSLGVSDADRNNSNEKGESNSSPSQSSSRATEQ